MRKNNLLIWKFIDNRWEDKFKRPLHKARYLLNLYYDYAKQSNINVAELFIKASFK